MVEIFAACMGTSLVYLISQRLEGKRIKFESIYWIWMVFVGAAGARLISYIF